MANYFRRKTEMTHYNATISLSLASSALPASITESVTWDRDVQLPILPAKDWVLVFDEGTKEEITAKVDQVTWFVDNNGEGGELTVACHLQFEENENRALTAYEILTTSPKWELEQ